MIVPLCLLVGGWAITFTLAQLHLAKPGVPRAAAGSNVVLGDAYRGETIFGQTCASCHGQSGKGGGIGPKLQGLAVSIARVKAQIDAGGGAMPASLLSGQKERDVLAYVAGLIAAPK